MAGWRDEMDRCTRLCCELGYHSIRNMTLSKQERFFFPIYDWRSSHDNVYGASRASQMRIGSSDAYIAYFSPRCRRSFEYIIHRLGQIQDDCEADTFHVVHRQRSIGYGFKEYAYSEQIRKPSFHHMPL